VRRAEAASYAEVLDYLESALKNGDYTLLRRDFAPVATYAKRFVTETQHKLASPPHSPAHFTGVRALRAMMALWSGRAQVGRPVKVLTTTAAELRDARQQWYAAVLPLPHEDLTARCRRLDLLLLGPMRDHRHALHRLLARPSRPSDVATQLTAWQFNAPIRRVRDALQRRLLAYA
jgi:hypothetical protein